MNITCNDGGIVITGQLMGEPGDGSGLQVAEICIRKRYDIPTYFDIQKYYDDSWASSWGEMEAITYKNGYSNVGYDLDDPTFMANVAHVKANTHFIWGNLEDGGLFVGKADYGGGNVYIYYEFCEGLYQNGNSGKYLYYIPAFNGYDHQIQLSQRMLLSECCVLTPRNNEDDIWLMFNDRISNGQPVSDSVLYTNPQIDPIRGVINVTRTTGGDAPISATLTNLYWEGKSAFLTEDWYWPVTAPSGVRGYKWTHLPIPDSDWVSLGGSWYGSDSNINYDPNADAGTNTVGGDHGDLDNHSDPIDFTDESQFTVDGINSGFITIYNPTQGQVSDFNDFLFTGITESISTVLKRLISSPLEYVISLSMVHYSPSNLSESSEAIKFCGLDSGVSAKRVTKQMQIIDCGSVVVNERLGSALDYGGYAKIKIYVPYCGIFPLSTDDVIGATLHGKFIIDQLTGNVIFQLKSTRAKRSTGDINNLDSVLYEFTGNCFNSLPISATDWRGLFQGACQIASGAAAMSTGNAVAGVSSIANGVMAMKPDVIKSGNLATTYGYMGKQKPYLIFEWPVQSLPAGFGSYKGYPANITRPLDQVKGYTEVDESTFWSMRIHGTEDEMNEIKDLMYSGVYL